MGGGGVGLEEWRLTVCSRDEGEEPLFRIGIDLVLWSDSATGSATAGRDRFRVLDYDCSRCCDV